MKWKLRVAPTEPAPLSDGALAAFFGAPDVWAAVQTFRRDSSSRFFLDGSAFKRAQAVAAYSPGAAERLLARGERILAHRLDILGSGDCDLGDQIPWRRDFISGHEWPLAHFSTLTIVDLDAGIDIKVPWELSRLHHLVTLGQCYALSGVETYAREVVAQLRDWWVQNPVEFGPNWSNAMEAAIRAANLIWACELVRGAPMVDDQFTADCLRSLIEHGRFINRYLEDGWPGSNHFLSDLCGLVWLGAYLSPARPARRWLRKGLRLLARELRTQIYPDGGDYESSTGYHLLVAEMLLWTAALCRARAVTVPRILERRLRDMLDVVAGMLRPDGALPLFGDCDSGRWLALESDTAALSSGQDPRGVLALGAALFREPRWAIAAGDAPARWEVAIWALGSCAMDASKKTAFNPQSSIRNPHFPHAGWHVLRRGDDYLAFEVGQVGAGGWGVHDHNDALSFEFAVGERAFIVDPGSYVYTRDGRVRNHFRGVAAHSTVQVEGWEINRVPERDLFRMNADARVSASRHENGLEAEAIVRRGQRELYRHRRRIEWLANLGCWLLTDTVQYSGPGTFTVRFHFAPLPLVLNGLIASTECTQGPNIAIVPCLPKDAPITVALESGWVSPRYGVRAPGVVLAGRVCCEGDQSLQWALLSFSGRVDSRRVNMIAARLSELPRH